jgi:hypothetical protein
MTQPRIPEQGNHFFLIPFFIHSHSPANRDSSSILRVGTVRWISSSVTEVGRLFLCAPAISLQQEKVPFYLQMVKKKKPWN